MPKCLIWSNYGCMSSVYHFDSQSEVDAFAVGVEAIAPGYIDNVCVITEESLDRFVAGGQLTEEDAQKARELFAKG